MKLYDGKPASPLTSDCEIKNIYDLVPKGAQMGVGFLTVNKIRLKHLSCCCFVCVFIIGQYHCRNNMSSKSGTDGEIFFESEKRHDI